MANHNIHKSFMHFCRATEASLSLPPELLLNIFAHLPHESVGPLLLVCRDWNALVSCPGSWTVWREWVRQAAPEVYEAALVREQSARKASPCWRALYVARESSRFLRRQRQQRQKQEDAARVEKEKQLREQEQLMMAQIAYTSMALSSEKKAWKQMLTVVSISSLTTFALFASMSLAY
ncbi:Fbox domain containing protein [Acanthamoeba castellanii str. Neff]|uniref:Fbox domain containing protein n=1 Tax=Acanthamoeba castellanii (strain ATCC 30010 / Neff) TaxID=1257118 RepID=L8HDM3_ACACF|nr:Fbox domain containing protein [Acanthamoeba castellanii str. Neff]ELR22496.1 Fbox domain containing protein [Acanthamoeba castellanii str. Neff]